uniref:Uncharacterized protein n=1 Tax=Arion vulgaris TaxID=1028688 RepID=A0A0B6ZMJ8_9EUPU
MAESRKKIYILYTVYLKNFHGWLEMLKTSSQELLDTHRAEILGDHLIPYENVRRATHTQNL